MADFDSDFTKTERDAFHSNIATLKARTPGSTVTAAQFDALLNTALDFKRVGVDDPQFTSEEREARRSLDANGVPPYPEYRHEFLMGSDTTYQAAWLYDNSELYRLEADAEPRAMNIVLLGRTNHAYRERDPEIVDRSLLRHGYRTLRDGESFPLPVVGRYAPKTSVSPPPLKRTRVLAPLG